MKPRTFRSCSTCKEGGVTANRMNTHGRETQYLGEWIFHRLKRASTESGPIISALTHIGWFTDCSGCVSLARLRLVNLIQFLSALNVKDQDVVSRLIDDE